MPPETDRPAPLSLDPILTTGAAVFGVRVRRVVFHLEDGREIAADLPAAADADGLTRTQARVLAALRSAPGGLTRKAVAQRLGLKSARGDLARAFQQLLETGVIFHRGGEYADDETKLRAAA